MDYILLIISAILIAANFVINNLYQQNRGTSAKRSIEFNMWLGLVSAIIFFVLGGFKCQITSFSVIMATISSLLCVLYTIIGFILMSQGNMSLFTLFLMAGGMIVPFFWGIVFLDENMSILHIIGLVLILSSLIINNSFDGKHVSVKTFLLCILIFVLNGFVSVISKVHQITPLTVSPADFVTLSGFSKFVLCIIALHIIKLISKSNKVLSATKGSKKYIFLLILLSSVFTGISFLFQLIGAKNINATALFPIVTGGSIIFTIIADWLIFKNKPSKKIVLGAILCFSGTCMFLQ